jgi:cyclase
VERVLQKMRHSTALIQALILALLVTGTASHVAGQVGTGQTVIQKATEQFENSPLKTTVLGQGLFMLSGDGGDVTAIVDNGSTLIIDSGMDTRVAELSDAIFKATMRPVTRLVNTHWHFDHTGGNVFFGSAGVTIIAQENVKKRLSSVQNVPFVGLRDGHYPPEALSTINYSSNMTLHQGPQQLTLVNYGPAHTDGDTVVYISPANVAVVGDIFSNHFYPIIDLESGGSIDGMIHSLGEILAD